MALTPHYGLQKLNAGDPFSTNGQKYTTSDRDLIDRLAYLGAQGHHHSGAVPSVGDPTLPLTLSVDTTAGSLPPGVRCSYKYAWVDAAGFETAASPEAFVSLPLATVAPSTPTVVAVPGAGTLVAGGYFYALSAYTGANTAETTAPNPFFTTLTAVGSNVVTFPTPPSGATGFNIYRKRPGGANYLYVTSVLATVPTWTDDGSLADDCNRFAPTINTTNATNTITATLPVGVVPAGYTWKLYRSLVVGQWTNSLLHWVIEQTTDTSGIIVTTFVDTGLASSVGMPASASTLLSAPTKINLATETTGSLPPAAMSAYPVTVTFTFPGSLIAHSGQAVWTCEYPWAYIVSVRAALGRGSVPASQPVIVDVLKGSGSNPSYASVFVGSRPQVGVGKQVGDAVVFNFTTPTAIPLLLGDSLSADLAQTGGGATPTDHDLTINVNLLVGSSALPTTVIAAP